MSDATNLTGTAVDVAACANCGAPLTGEYCAACGQARRSPVTSLRAFFAQVLDDAGNLDIKLLRSLGALLIRPGHLTREYLDGRRARWTQPVQLYLLGAAAFFFTASFRPMLWIDPQARYIVASLPGMSVGNRLPAGTLRELAAAGVPLEVFADRFVNAINAWLPAFLIGSVLIFSLAVYALYFRHERRYLPHAVLALHWTAFYLLVLAVTRLPPVSWRLQDPTLLLALAWLTLALRRVYAESILLSFAKAVVLAFAFLFVLFLWAQSATSIGLLTVRGI